jgi:hypothetical protein
MSSLPRAVILDGRAFSGARSTGQKQQSRPPEPLLQLNAGSRLSQPKGYHEYNNFRLLTAMTKKNGNILFQLFSA